MPEVRHAGIQYCSENNSGVNIMSYRTTAEEQRRILKRYRKMKRRKIIIRRAAATAAAAAGAGLLFFCGMEFFRAGGSLIGMTSRSGEKYETFSSLSGRTEETEQQTGSGQAEEEKKNASQPDDWNLVLVNPWNEIPEGYEVNLTQLKNNQAIDTRCYPQLQRMMDDCRAAGLNPLICASYRTMEKQQELFEDKKQRVIAEGCPENEAEEEAAKTVALPGTSEHQLGLAVDIVDMEYQRLDTAQENTPVQRWLMKNSWKYGFVLRYPTEKSKITGIIYEPWHYRYVGQAAAKEMYRKNLCLEEYLAQQKNLS